MVINKSQYVPAFSEIQQLKVNADSTRDACESEPQIVSKLTKKLTHTHTHTEKNLKLTVESDQNQIVASRQP